MNEFDEIPIDIGLRRKSDDKLTYKLIIASRINECGKNEGRIREYPNAVMALANTLSFDIKGYNLRQQINKEMELLDDEKEVQYKIQEENIPRWKFHKRSYQNKFRNRLDRWYWETLFERVLQILASEGLLFDTERLIPIKLKRDTEGFVDDIETGSEGPAINDI